jgi:hypothetical protein
MSHKKPFSGTRVTMNRIVTQRFRKIGNPDGTETECMLKEYSNILLGEPTWTNRAELKNPKVFPAVEERAYGRRC